MTDWLQRLDALIGPRAGVIKNLMAPLFIVMVLAMMVLPLPAFALDTRSYPRILLEETDQTQNDAGDGHKIKCPTPAELVVD